MSAFWTLFWIAFAATPILFLVSRLAITSGRSTSGTHIWVFADSHRKVGDASIRDVWQHRHPGKDWDKAQRSGADAFFVALVVFGVAIMGELAAGWLDLPKTMDAANLFQRFGSGALGALAGGAFLYLQSVIMSRFSAGIWDVLNAIAIFILIAGIAIVLILTLLRKPLWFSPHFLWIPIGAPGLFWLIDRLISRSGKERAAKGGANLDQWVHDMVTIANKLPDVKERYTSVEADDSGVIYYDFSHHYRKYMKVVVQAAGEGALDGDLLEGDLLVRTERIMVGLVSGRRLVMENDDMIKAQEEIVKAVQAVYFRGVQYLGLRLHPRVMAALKRKK